MLLTVILKQRLMLCLGGERLFQILGYQWHGQVKL